jgi:hypothetical protein
MTSGEQILQWKTLSASVHYVSNYQMQLASSFRNSPQLHRVMESCMDKLSITYKQSTVLQTRIICATNISVWFLRVSQNRPLHQNVVTRPAEQNFHFGLQLLPTLQLWILSLDFQLWSIFQNSRLRSSKRTLVFSFIPMRRLPMKQMQFGSSFEIFVNYTWAMPRYIYKLRTNLHAPLQTRKSCDCVYKTQTKNVPEKSFSLFH